MTNRRSREFARSATLVASLAAGLLGLAACGGAPAEQSAPAGSTRVVEAHPYKIDSGVDNALAFFDNQHVIEGTVVSTGPDVLARDVLDTGTTFEAVYTPVTLRITEVYRGTLTVGSQVVLRAMGGVAAGLAYRIDDAPAKSTFTPGATLVVFGGQYSTVDSERQPALTPNFLYRLTGGEFVDATYATGGVNGSAPSRVAVGGLRDRLRALPAVPRRG